MNTLVKRIELTRFLILASLLILAPALIDLQITIAAGPDSKFRVLEFGVFLAALCSLPLWISRRSPVRLNIGVASILAWIVYILFRAALDSHRAYAFDIGFRTIAWLLFILLLADACSSHKDFIRLVWIAVLGQLAPVGLAVGNIFGVDIYLNWIVGEQWRWYNPLMGEDRSVIWSSLGNPNFYANYGAILLIWLLIILALSRRWWSRTLTVGYLIVLLITLAYTFTRGVWASLIPAFCMTFASIILRQIKFYFRIADLINLYGKRTVLAASAFLILFLSVYALEPKTGPLHSTARRFQHGLQFRDASLRSRPLLWYAALRMWRDNPVWGQGIGRYAPRFLATVYNSTQETDPQRIQHITREMNTIRTDQAHNDYLQILAETGLAGYGLFLLFLLSFLSLALRGLFSPAASRIQLILLTGCLAILFTIIVQCVYDFPLMLPSSAVLFSLAAAGILILTRRENSREFFCPPLIRWGIYLALAPVLILAMAFVVQHLLASHNLDKGFRYWNNGFESVKQNDLNTALTNFQLAEKHVQRANRLYDNYGVILFELGRIYASQAQIQNDPRLRARAIAQFTRANETYCVPESYYWLCKLYLDDSAVAQAQKMSDILLVIDPEREDAHLLAAQVDYKSRKYEDAARHLLLEMKRHPQNTRALALMGAIEQDQFGRPGEAAAYYKKLLEIESGSIDVHMRLGDALASLGGWKEAQRHYETGLEGAKALGLSDLEQTIERKLDDLQTKLINQEGDSNESRSQ